MRGEKGSKDIDIVGILHSLSKLKDERTASKVSLQ